MNPRRGHESSVHLEAKIAVGRLFNDPEWSVFYEQRNADVLVLHNATKFVAAIEVESSPRNVLRNLERNMSHGCQAVAVVALTERYLGQITSKILGSAVYENHRNIKVFLYRNSDLNALRDWLIGLAAQGEKPEGGRQ